MKIRLVGAELFHADRRTDVQTDTTKLTVAFRNFANAPKDAGNHRSRNVTHNSWSIVCTSKFDKATFNCIQVCDTFQHRIWSVTKSSAGRHCIVSGQCVAAVNEVFQRSHLSRPGIPRPLTCH
jgi:hypothetical protein